jgi:hypothetical protein
MASKRKRRRSQWILKIFQSVVLTERDIF